MKESLFDIMKSIPVGWYKKLEKARSKWDSWQRIAPPCPKCGKKIPFPPYKNIDRDPFQVSEMCNNGYCYRCAWAIHSQP